MPCFDETYFDRHVTTTEMFAITDVSLRDASVENELLLFCRAVLHCAVFLSMATKQKLVVAVPREGKRDLVKKVCQLMYSTRSILSRC